MLKPRIDKLEQKVIKSNNSPLRRIVICKEGETPEQAKNQLGIAENGAFLPGPKRISASKAPKSMG